MMRREITELVADDTVPGGYGQTIFGAGPMRFGEGSAPLRMPYVPVGTVAINDPGSVYDTSTVSLTATATGDTDTLVWRDGASLIGSVAVGSPIEWEVDGAGDHTIAVEGYAGAVYLDGDSLVVTVLEETPPATITVDNPGTVYEGVSGTFSAATTGDVDSVDFYWSDDGNTWHEFGTDSSGTTSWSLDGTITSSGSITIRARAYAGAEVLVTGTRSVSLVAPYVLSDYAGAAIGNFASTRYAKGPNGSGVDVGAARGKACIIGWEQHNGVSNGDSCLYGVGSTSAGNRKGIWFNDGSGGHPYLFALSSGAATAINLSTSNSYSRGGSNAMAVGFMSNGSVRTSVNGGAAHQASAAATIDAINGDTACEHTIGVTPVGHQYPCRGRVQYVIWVDREPTDQELQDWSNQSNAVNRRVPHPDLAALGDDLIEHMSIVRDWNGTDATFTSGLGTAPTTFTNVGAVARYELERERIFTEQQWMWHYTTDYTAEGSGATARHTVSCGAELVLRTDAVVASAKLINTYTSISSLHTVGVHDGTTLGSVFVHDVGRPLVLQANVASGTKNVRWWTVFQSWLAGGTHYGIWLQELRLPMSASWEVLRQSTPARLIIGCGDSLFVGDTSLDPAKENLSTQLRYTDGGYPGAVQGRAWGGWALADDSSTEAKRIAYAAELAGAFAGVATPEVLFLGPTNDFGLPRCSAANYGAYMADVLDRMRAEVPALHAYLVTPLWRGNQDTPNATYGNVLEQYRQAYRDLATSRASWVTIIEGENAVTHPDNFAADLLHLRSAGETQVFNTVRAGIGY